MRSLHSMVTRNLAVRKARTVLTALGIALGVAAIVATGIVNESATRSVADTFDQAAGRADLVTTNAMAGIVGGEGFQLSTLERVREFPGVEAAAPLLQISTLPTAQLNEWEYSFLAGNFSGSLIFGLDPAASRAMGHYQLQAGQDLPGDSVNSILLTHSLAEALGVSLGDSLEFVAPAGQVQFTVLGLLAPIGLARLNQEQVGVTSLGAAQRAFNRPDRLDQIDIVVASGSDIEAQKLQLQEMLGDRYRVFRPASKGALVDQMLASITFGLGFIGALTLVVGGFLIYNTFATTVAERMRELGLLRALGMDRGQTIRLVLSEAALLGLCGAAVGILLGILLAMGMKEIAAAAVNSELRKLVVLPEHVISGLVVGLVIAPIASLVPAVRASRVAVVEAIHHRRRDNSQSTFRQTRVGLLLAAPSLAITIAYRFHPVKAPFELFFLVLITLLAGMGLLIPVAVPLLERPARGALGFLGVDGQLGGRNLTRSPGRAALTAGALMFGLASVIVIGSVFAGAKELADDYMEKTLAAELWIYAPQRLPRSLASDIETIKEVRLARPAASIPTHFLPPDPAQPEVAVIYTAIDPERSKGLDYYFASDGGSEKDAIPRLVSGGAVFIASPLREWYGFQVGDTIRLRTLEGPTDFEIAGVTLDLTASGYSVLGVYDDAIRYFGVDRADIIAVNLWPDTDAIAASRRILDEWGTAFNLRVETSESFRARSSQLSDSFAALSNTAVLVGVVVAALGVANTLLMNVFERQREIAMLRSLGMTRGQVLRMILSESTALGALGGLLGISTGIWLSHFAVTSSQSVSGYELPHVFPWQAVTACVIIAAVVPFFSGLWPAWRGARANVVEAMRGE